MGMYTEIVLKAELKEDLPADVESVFQYFFNEGDKPTQLPDHPLFKTRRWDFMFQCSSFYHHPEVVGNFHENGRYVFWRSDLKDYDEEISKFFDWADQYFVGETGQCLGWSWYEEEIAPTLVFKK